MKTLRFTRTVWAVLLLGTLAFTGFRIAQLFRYGDTTVLGQETADVLRAFWTGARFDFKMLATALLVLFMPASLIALPMALRRAGGTLQRIVVVLLFFVANFAAICQYYYYGFYKTPFSPIVFGLYEDDTQGVLASIWGDYPVIAASLLVIVLTAVQAWLTFRIAARPDAAEASGSPDRPARGRLRIVWGAVAVVALALFARGSFGTFPLHNQDATISANPFVNDLVRNAWQTLYDANKDRRQQIHITSDPTSRLKAYGFRSLDDVARALGAPSGKPDDLQKLIYRHTPHNDVVAAHPPHVIFALMESWGANQLEFDTPQNNLTGAMRKHLQHDILFNNFFSAGLGTHPTMEALLLNSPLSPLTQGEYGYATYPEAAPKPFKAQGYRTIFIYGGSNEWRSVGRVMKRQYFDEVYDMSDIMARYPDAQRNIWGVYDEYLFRFAYDLLKDGDAHGQKIFLFLLTTTNHPPHSVPAHYKPLPLDFSEMGKHFGGDAQSTGKMVLTYQYATNQLGLFLDRIDASPLGAKTIVAATGDHNMRVMLKYRQPTDTKELYRVPGYFHVPAAYRPAFAPDLNRYAGHRDMFPTLYNLALSDATYPSFGENLFAPLPEREQFTMVAFQSMFSKEGALLPFTGSAPAAFQWDVTQTTLALAPHPSAMLLAQGAQARAWLALQDWYTRYEVIRLRHAGAPHD